MKSTLLLTLRILMFPFAAIYSVGRGLWLVAKLKIASTDPDPLALRDFLMTLRKDEQIILVQAIAKHLDTEEEVEALYTALSLIPPSRRAASWAKEGR